MSKDGKRRRTHDPCKLARTGPVQSMDSCAEGLPRTSATLPTLLVETQEDAAIQSS